ncbi:MAG TPA: TonB-dependent receptor [Candidatus Eisenbacteria bacterium]|jgi:hypothetical protein|nr:TonB-dependent receptor [Candidatus Eisenbacteria bacterium]
MVLSKVARTALLLAGLLVVFSARLFGQGVGSSTISGTVTDPSGAPIPGAQVVVTQDSTAVARATTTSENGAYTFSSLQPASYAIHIEAPGFKSLTEHVTLLADQVRALDERMEIGQANQQVTVEASAVLVNTVTPVLSQVIEQTRVVSIPLVTRNAADLTLLVPGTTVANGHGVQQGDTKQVAVGSKGVAESISVNGARPDQISYNLDGANNEDLMSNTNNPFPFPDALQEFSVQTNSFDARYGTNAGAVVNVVTKSGTNQWHGDAFEFVRNKIFNAHNFFAKPPAGSGDARDPLKQNQFGGVIGGPIRKNKTFIFFGYQGTRIRTVNNASNAKVPTAANMAGDFSSICTSGFDASGICLDRNASGQVIDQIFNPATGLPFPGNTGLPVDPVAASFAQLLPVSSADAAGNVTFQTPLSHNLNEYVARFDQVVRGKDRLFVRFYLDRFVHAAPFDGADLLTVAAGSTVQNQNWAVGYTSVFGSNWVNSFVIDVVREASDRGQGGKVPQLSDFGSNIFQLPQSEGGIRNFAVSNYFTIGNFTDARFVRNTGDIRDDATWTHGRHTFTFGGNYERDQSNIRNTDLENGSFSITTDTAHPANMVVNSAQAAANFVLGHVRSISQTSGDFSDSRQNVFGLYLQDSWKIRPRLTLTLGLRYEPQGVMKEIYGRTEQFRPDAYAAGVRSTVVPSAPAGLFFVGDSFNGIGFPDTGQAADRNNFAPRVGFAWDISGSGKTVIRGGGGTFYSSRLPGLFLNDASISQPFSLRIDLTEPPTPNNLIPLANPLVSDTTGFAASFPARFTLADIPSGVAFHPPVSVFGLEPGRRWVTPTIYDWNLTVERQVKSDTVVRASYVGLRGTHLRQDVDLNPRGIGIGTEASRPYTGFSDILENQNNGMSNFNALEVEVEKRPSAGSPGILKNITLLANYTYSKAMDIALAANGGTTDVGSSKGSGVPYGNPLQASFETGPADFDHTHRAVASYVWDLPRFRDRNAFERWTLGGWQWSGVFTFVTGDAFTVLSGQDQSKTNLGGDRAQYVGPAGLYGQVAPKSLRSGCPATPGDICVPWLDTALFTQPAVGTFGNVGKNAFRGPNNWNVDMGLHKTFYPLANHENFGVQLRAEFFNVFNHTQLNVNVATNNNTIAVSSASFGAIRNAYDPRIIQLALKVSF